MDSKILNLKNNYLDKFLEKSEIYEKVIGEGNFKKVKDEFNNKNKNNKFKTIDIVREIDSLIGEIISFRQLKKEGYENLEKINEIGDWENEDSIISIKSKNNLDYNYFLIEQIIVDLMCKNNQFLRGYHKIYFKNLNRCSYHSLKSIGDFLINSLSLYIVNFDKKINEEDDNHSELYKDNNKNFNVNIFGYINNKNEKYIEFNFTLNEMGKESHFEIKLEKNEKYKDYLLIDYDTNCFWESHPLDYDKLKIDEYIKKFDDGFKRINNKKFIGWINIPIHAQSEIYILRDKPKIEEILNKYKQEKYKIYFCFYPQFGFDLKRPVIIKV